MRSPRQFSNPHLSRGHQSNSLPTGSSFSKLYAHGVSRRMGSSPFCLSQLTTSLDVPDDDATDICNSSYEITSNVESSGQVSKVEVFVGEKSIVWSCHLARAREIGLETQIVSAKLERSATSISSQVKHTYLTFEACNYYRVLVNSPRMIDLAWMLNATFSTFPLKASGVPQPHSAVLTTLY